MDFGLISLTAGQQAFAAEVRAVLTEIVTPDVLDYEHETGEGFSERVHLALGARGWLTPSWPKEEGGAGLDAVRRRILDAELTRYHVPMITAGTTALIWPAVDRYAEPELRAEVKKGVADGTVRMCLGYTEPDGGSDLAAAKLRAVRDGERWLLSGSKIFTTGAQNCQYCFLLARTHPDRPKHKGLSMFLVPLSGPGITIQAVRTFGGERTNIVYYDDVRVPDRYLLGEAGEGWTVLHGPLDVEHGAGGDGSEPSIGAPWIFVLREALSAAAEWAGQPGPDGRRPADDPAVLARLGRIAADIEAAEVTTGPLGRVKCSDVLISCAAGLVDLTGLAGLLGRGTPGAPGNGAIDYAHRFAQGTATYAGTVEVFRTMIATRMLGLPRLSYPGSREFLPAGRRQPGAVVRPAAQ